ncbi:MAG: DUF3106 domain-containing protein [Betaproteobacteria bacterium]|jgi:hypothetical protein
MPGSSAPASPVQSARLALLAAFAMAWLTCAAGALASDSVAWSRLNPVQQQALAPLQADWATLSGDRQAKWLEVASRFPTMSAAERQRLNERMAEWVRMTPEQRRTARLQFQEVHRVPPEDRQAAWKAYQALPEAERQRLAQQRSGPVSTPAQKSTPVSKAKSNVVQSAPVVPKRAAAPAMQQARSGATTSPMNRTPLPPASIQHGLPKIAATPGFVDPATLLPLRGPQGAAAAVESEPAASAAES